MDKINVVIEKSNTGYSAYFPEYPVITTGKNLEDLKVNILEAINLYFEETGNGKVNKESDLNFTFDLQSFFDFHKIINAKALSEKIGMNQSLLAQYISGFKKPSLNQAERIFDAIRQLGVELSQIGFIVKPTEKTSKRKEIVQPNSKTGKENQRH